MVTSLDIAALIADKVEQLPAAQLRNVISISGPPASGKSTIATALCNELNLRGIPTGLVAMDGFHLDNSILEARDLRDQKGAPETFDLAGFSALIARLSQEPEVIVPTFDRERDISVGASAVVTPDMTTAVVEGNYLLLDAPGWRELSNYWTLSVSLSLELSELERRLVERWLQLGFNDTDAREKVLMNDLPNAKRVLRQSVEADVALDL